MFRPSNVELMVYPFCCDSNVRVGRSEFKKNTDDVLLCWYKLMYIEMLCKYHVGQQKNRNEMFVEEG